MADLLGVQPSLWQTTIGNSTQNNTQNQNFNGTTGGVNQNTFTAGQQALQGQALGGYSGLLQGQSIPTNFQVPQATIDRYVAMYNKYVAPQRAAQFGSGSPTIATGLQEGLADLLGQGVQGSMSNYMNAINGAANVAFSPTGNTATGTSTGNQINTSNQTGNFSQHNIDSGGILGDIAASVKKILFP